MNSHRVARTGKSRRCGHVGAALSLGGILFASAGCGGAESSEDPEEQDTRTGGVQGAAACQPKATVFLNFGGATLHRADAQHVCSSDATFAGVTSATANCVQTIGPGRQLGPLEEFDFPAFSQGPEVQAEITATVQEALDLLGIEVVTSRPAAGRYHMVMVGGLAEDFGYAAGTPGASRALRFFGSPDCDNIDDEDIVFAFERNTGGGTTQTLTAATLSVLVQHYLGNMLGMNDVKQVPPGDPRAEAYGREVMGLSLGNGQTYTNATFPPVDGVGCEGAFFEQNSIQVLYRNFSLACDAPKTGPTPVFQTGSLEPTIAAGGVQAWVDGTLYSDEPFPRNGTLAIYGRGFAADAKVFIVQRPVVPKSIQYPVTVFELGAGSPYFYASEGQVNATLPGDVLEGPAFLYIKNGSNDVSNGITIEIGPATAATAGR